MKKLKTDLNGGFPLVLDDIRWMNSGLIEALMQSWSKYINGNQTIISGCSTVLSGGNYTVQEGYMWHFGEVCYVPAQVVPDSSKAFQFFDLSVTYDPAGSKTFLTSSPPNYDTYEIRTLVLIQSDSLPTGYLSLGTIPEINEGVRLSLNLIKPTPWLLIPSSFYDIVKPEGGPQYKVDTSGFIHLRGAITKAGSFTNATVGVLPPGARPLKDIVLNMYNVGYDVWYTLTIQSVTGNINVTSSGMDGYIRLSNIPPFQ